MYKMKIVKIFQSQKKLENFLQKNIENLKIINWENFNIIFFLKSKIYENFLFLIWEFHFFLWIFLIYFFLGFESLRIKFLVIELIFWSLNNFFKQKLYFEKYWFFFIIYQINIIHKNIYKLFQLIINLFRYHIIHILYT